jgi:hypothetical protein
LQSAGPLPNKVKAPTKMKSAPFSIKIYNPKGKLAGIRINASQVFRQFILVKETGKFKVEITTLKKR